MAGNFSLPTEGLYKDAKKILKYAVSPLIYPIRQHLKQRQQLRVFSPQLIGHSCDVTSFPDYYAWHEEDKDWRGGHGLVVCATYRELLQLWTLPDHFVPYEAMLKGFLDRGGEIRRVFLVGPDLADPIRLWALQRTLLRHKRLGFEPRILGLLEIRASLRRLGINCDHFGTLNGRIAYFFRHHDDQKPLMMRTLEPKLVARAENEAHLLWKKAEKFEGWYSRQPYHLPPEIIRQVDLDVNAVNSATSSRPL